MPIFLLIRHGDNDLMRKYLVGRSPGVHLNEKGQQQAQNLARLLAEAPLAAVFSSPMERALETARPLAEIKNLEIQQRQGLIELNYGAWMGRSFGQLQRTALWKQLKADPSEVRFPEGESICEAQERAVRELEAIASLVQEKDMVACFTHGDIVRLLVAHYLDMPLRAYQKLSINTASITVLAIDKDKHAYLLHLNQVDGLELKPLQKKQRKKPEAPK
jgi:broad specificity phosphatase PhoE